MCLSVLAMLLVFIPGSADIQGHFGTRIAPAKVTWLAAEQAGACTCIARRAWVARRRPASRTCTGALTTRRCVMATSGAWTRWVPGRRLQEPRICAAAVYRLKGMPEVLSRGCGTGTVGGPWSLGAAARTAGHARSASVSLTARASCKARALPARLQQAHLTARFP